MGAEGSEVAQGLGLLLETHDAVLLEHDAVPLADQVIRRLGDVAVLLEHGAGPLWEIRRSGDQVLPPPGGLLVSLSPTVPWLHLCLRS